MISRNYLKTTREQTTTSILDRLASKEVIALNKFLIGNVVDIIPCDYATIRQVLDDHADLLFKLDQAMRAIKTLSPRDADLIMGQIPSSAETLKFRKDLRTYASLARQVK